LRNFAPLPSRSQRCFSPALHSPQTQEANGLYTLDQKLTGADGKEIDANTWDFDLKKDGKMFGHVHRVVSADGKTLSVHNTGVQLSGAVGDETLVFDKQ
jgi:hypothetical protein